VIDNMLMSGDVALAPGEPTSWSAGSVAAARALNGDLMSDERWLACVLPVGDGIGLAARSR
jgi:predicted O-methyltransferase YrrM